MSVSIRDEINRFVDKAFHNVEKRMFGDFRSQFPWLFPFYRIFAERTKEIANGIFIMDSKGIYSPILEENYESVIQVVRFPFNDQPVVGLTDLGNMILFEIQTGLDSMKYLAIVGVTQNGRLEWKFISDTFFIKPISNAAIANSRVLVDLNADHEAARPMDQVDYDDDDVECWN